jgi:membrane fusion protein, multidrug efflux system
MPKKSHKHLFVFVLSTALGVAGCTDGGGGSAPGGAVPVTVVTLETQPVTISRELPGRTRASLVAEVRPQVSGIVREQLFVEGGRVVAGQALYQLEDASYRAEAASARAALARAEAARDVARLRADRSSQVVKAGGVSQQDHDNVMATLRQAEAEVGVAQAAAAARAVTLGYARITASITGQIGRSAVTRGALVTANQPEPLATIQQLDPLYVDLAQSSAELLELRRALAAGTLESTDSLPVAILLEDGSTHPEPGELAFSEVTVDPSTGSFILRVVVPNPGQRLLPGMYVQARVVSGARQQALLVPQQAVARDPKGNTSVLLVADGKVEQRPIRVSRTVGDAWLVESGLVAGDRVIVAGLQKIRPGAAVEATERQPAALAPAATAPQD